jgi:hypothetical protein
VDPCGGRGRRRGMRVAAAAGAAVEAGARSPDVSAASTPAHTPPAGAGRSAGHGPAAPAAEAGARSWEGVVRRLFAGLPGLADLRLRRVPGMGGMARAALAVEGAEGRGGLRVLDLRCGAEAAFI